MIDHLFIIGYPSEIGGANTELWHTVKLWRRFGLGVTLLPTWQADRGVAGPAGCASAAARSFAGADALDDVPGLAGSVVVSFCNTKFLAVAERIGPARLPHDLGGLHELALSPGAAALSALRPVRPARLPEPLPARSACWRSFAATDSSEQQGRIIRGAIDAGEIPLPAAAARGGRAVRRRPHQPRRSGQVLADALEDVWADSASGAGRGCWAGSETSRPAPGPPPPWAECLPGRGPAGRRVPRTLHALVQANAAAVENWPRVGLEAMAAGVPLVVDAKGGWQEMLRHGRTGYLCRTDDEQAYYAARLAYDEEHRLRLAAAPRGPDRRAGRPARPLVAMARIVRELGHRSSGTVPIFADTRSVGPMAVP